MLWTTLPDRLKHGPDRPGLIFVVCPRYIGGQAGDYGGTWTLPRIVGPLDLGRNEVTCILRVPCHRFVLVSPSPPSSPSQRHSASPGC